MCCQLCCKWFVCVITHLQVQQSPSGQATQFLQVTPATSQTVSSVIQPQQTTVTVPSNLVAASALRATPTPPNAVTRPQTPTQISLVPAPAPLPTVSAVSAVQVGDGFACHLLKNAVHSEK